MVGSSTTLELAEEELDSSAELERVPWLVVRRQGACTLFPLRVGEAITIGRSSAADLVLDEPWVSARHASLQVSPVDAWITDLGSRNGTQVNGQRITEAHLLRAGDVISLGTVTIAYCRDPPHVARDRQNSAPAATLLDLGGDPVVAGDPVIRGVFLLIRRLAANDIPVLILGETGTGKEIAALALHRWSRRARGRLVPVNCAALPETLIESELFGHEKGAFTGAETAKPGQFEAAQGGTLFLDEVGELSLSAQAKLLRVLDTRRVTRVGSVTERAIDIRIVSATNRPLEEAIAQRRFREDLYFRLRAGQVTLPPLRARPTDLEPLVELFLAQGCARLRRSRLTLAPAAMAILARYAWPGNIRELRGAMDYLVASVVDPVIEPGHLPPWIAGAVERAARETPVATAVLSPERTAPVLQTLPEERRALERVRISDALRAAHGVQIRAAKMLGISRTTLRKHIVDLELWDLVRGDPNEPD